MKTKQRFAVDALPPVTAPLLRWYDEHARDLPWRRDPTPYHVWVSEIMLQQTRVEAVRDYYTRFLAALPDIAALAAAGEDALLKLWEGLGYYNRVRSMQAAAKEVVDSYGGELPASRDELLTLPGIGGYTAGAIASIAFGIPVPAVDGNVLRVLSRLICSRADIAVPAVKEAFGTMLPGVIPADRPGDFNQALMDLGATICLPNGEPLCESCPVMDMCAAHREGCARELPVKAAKKPRKREERTIVLVIAGDKLLLWRRGKGLLSGMYEPLNLEGHQSPEALSELISSWGGGEGLPELLGPAKHIFTHVEWHMVGYCAACEPFPAPEGAVWADLAMLNTQIAVPSAFRAYMGTIGKSDC